MKTELRTLAVETKYRGITQEASTYELDDMEIAVRVRRLELMAGALQTRGFRTRLFNRDGECFSYICVYSPDDSIPGEWATLTECRQLLDTIANLSPVEAFARWSKKIEPFAVQPYTESDRIRDMKQERTEARKRYESGVDNAEDFKIAWSNARG